MLNLFLKPSAFLFSILFASQLLAAEPTCPWADHSTYSDLRQNMLFRHDLPGDLYTKESISHPHLTKREAIEDLQCLQLIFETAYSATAYFKDRGIDLVERVNRLIEEIRRHPYKISRARLLNDLSSIHDQAFDGHAYYFFINTHAALNGPDERIGTARAPNYPQLVYIDSRFTKRDGTIFLVEGNDQTPIGSCQNLSPSLLAASELQPGLGEVTFTGYLPNLPDNAQAQCQTKSGKVVKLPLAAVQRAEDSKPSPEARSQGALLEQWDDNVQYLRIGRFPQPMTAQQEKIAEQLGKTGQKLIIDTRGIGGGAPPFKEAIENALLTAGRRYHSSDSEKLFSLLSLVGVAQVYKDMEFEALWDPELTEQQRQEKLESLRSTLAGWDESAKTLVERFELNDIGKKEVQSWKNYAEGTRPNPVGKPIILLIDRGCGSQCEFLVSALRHHPKVKVLGVPTAGRLNFASNGSLYLPNSKIQFIPSSARTTHIPDAPEGEGIRPDRYIISADATKIADEIINRQR